jgi:hypothetical protein
MEAVLNQNFLYIAFGVFVVVILITSFILDRMENDDSE